LETYLAVDGACVGFHGEGLGGVVASFTSLFSRRYLPDPRIVDYCGDSDIELLWLRSKGFTVLAAEYRHHGFPDRYIVEGGPVEPYVNEAPVFFLLQALARRLVYKGRLLLTDSVSIYIPSTGEAVLLLGYPHTGKSTISSIAYSKGYSLLSTENTVVEVANGELWVRSGSSILVYDPRVKSLYGAVLEPVEKTKHGYEIIDVNTGERLQLLNRGVRASSIYVLHTNFSSQGVSLEPLRGRKIGKTLWYFMMSLLKGMDFYEPMPLDIPLNEISKLMVEYLESIRREYDGRVFEVFGSPLEVFLEITRREASQR